MKRQAEKQLIKGDDDNEEEDSSGQGFKKADERILATRVIRGLPKGRLGGGSAPAGSSEPPKPPSLFSPPPGGGGGGGLFSTPPAPAPSPFSGFSFKAPTTTSSESNLLPSPSPSSSAAPVKTSLTFPSTTASPPSLASTATNTSKTFATLLSNTSAFPTSTPASTSTSAIKDEGTSDEANALKYYTNLRGLNVSFLSAISKAAEEDPFVDMARVFESYKSTRAKIQKEYEEGGSSVNGHAKAGEPSTATTGKVTMPTPPASFAFGPSKGSTMTTTPATTSTSDTGSAPKPSFFEFKPPAAATTTTSSPFGSSSTTTSSSPFGGSSSMTAPSPFGGSSNNTAASPFGGSSSTSFASTSKDKETSANTHTTPVFGGSTFGETSLSKPVDSSSSTTKPGSFFSFAGIGDKSTPSPFGTTAGSTSSPFGAPAATSSPFTFGASSGSGSKSAFGSSTAAAGAKPSFFSFGATNTGTTTSSSAPPSIFGGMKPTTESSESIGGGTEGTGVEGEVSDRATQATESGDTGGETPALMPTNSWTEEGEGEENEETTHSVKAKAYKLTKGDDGNSKWAPLGTGMIKLKKHKETSARRMLLRNATNGKVIINFNVYDGLKPTQTKAALSFIGHEATESVTYSVRLANENDANQFKDALNREIAFVKAKVEV